MDKFDVLGKYFGYSSFRKGQEEMVDWLLSCRDALGIMPTGAGKSICYQVPAIMFSGVTIVVSPLISLMKDQINALVQQGVTVRRRIVFCFTEKEMCRPVDTLSKTPSLILSLHLSRTRCSRRGRKNV
ncbi:hypothetical protein DW843_08855 [Ruminococcus sp. AM36-18]|nr:DEAD/DEAH box helicase [Ruminococcus sp. AM36-18]RGH57087.1 hypothetical protein DW843_08855 [Ruminococcus sp. AM36-18]